MRTQRVDYNVFVYPLGDHIYKCSMFVLAGRSSRLVYSKSTSDMSSVYENATEKMAVHRKVRKKADLEYPIYF